MAWHDTGRTSPEIRQGYKKTFQVTNWDLVLWELTKATHPTDVPDKLHTISVPTLVVTGDDDRIATPELSQKLAEDIHGATFQIIPRMRTSPSGRTPFTFYGSCAKICF